MYEHFEHKADIGIRGKGIYLSTAFSECAKALYAVMTDISKVKPVKEFFFKVSADNKEELLVEFLNELISKTDLDSTFFSEFKVNIKGKNLECTAKGEKINVKKHELLTEVKAATYSQLKVYKRAKKWTAQTVVDV